MALLVHKVNASVKAQILTTMNKQEIDSFNRLYADEGGYYDLQKAFDILIARKAEVDDMPFLYRDIHDIAIQLIDLQSARYKKLPEIHFGFIQSPKLGVVVTKDDLTGEYFIGLYFGTIYLLRNFFSQLLCSPLVLNFIGAC